MKYLTVAMLAAIVALTTAASAHAQTGVNIRTKDGAAVATDRIRVQTSIGTAQVLFVNSFIEIDNQNALRLRELSTNGTNFVALRAPGLLGADVTLTFPNSAGALNQVLTTDGAGILSWTTPSGGVTSVEGAVGVVDLASPLGSLSIANGGASIANLDVVFAGTGIANTAARSDHTHVNGPGIGGPYVTAVTATGIMNSSGGTTPNITLTGIVPIANGGTNSGAALAGSSIMISNGSAIVQGLAGTTTTVLHGNAAGAPTYSTVSLSGDVSGTLPVGSGGTGATTFTTNQFLWFDGTNVAASGFADTSFVKLGPAAAQVDSSANPLIFLNKTVSGVGNMMTFQKNGVQKFTLSNAGNTMTFDDSAGGTDKVIHATFNSLNLEGDTSVRAMLDADNNSLDSSEAVFFTVRANGNPPNLFTVSELGNTTLIGTSAGQAEMRLGELTTNGTQYIAHRATAALGVNTTYTWPAAPAVGGQFLSSDTSGNLSWAAAGGAGVSTVDYGAGPFSGAVTLPASGTTNYVQNQNVGAQVGNYWINGTGIAANLSARPTANGTNVLDARNAAGTTLFRVDSTNNRVVIENNAMDVFNFSPFNGFYLVNASKPADVTFPLFGVNTSYGGAGFSVAGMDVNLLISGAGPSAYGEFNQMRALNDAAAQTLYGGYTRGETYGTDILYGFRTDTAGVSLGGTAYGFYADLSGGSATKTGLYVTGAQEGIRLAPYGAGAGQTTELRFGALAGANYVGFKAPDALAVSNMYALPTGFPAVSGQVLSSTTAGVLSWAAGGGSGTVTSVTAGTGLTATPVNPITTSGTINLANTAVFPGSYTNASITVDAQGRLTAASSGVGGGVTSYNGLTGAVTGVSTFNGLSGAVTGVSTVDYGSGAFSGAVTLPASGTTNYVQNQFTATQTGAGLWVSGNARADGYMIVGTPVGGAATYSMSTIVLNYEAFAGTAIVLGDDATTGNIIPVGFTFNFYSTDYTTVDVSSNGFLAFAATGNGCCSGSCLPTPVYPPLVAGYWEDLYPPAGGTITYATLGVAPFRRFVLQFDNIQHFLSGNPVFFEIKLFETTNVVEIHYNSCPTDGGTHTSGIQDAGANAVTAVNCASTAMVGTARRFDPPNPLPVLAAGDLEASGHIYAHSTTHLGDVAEFMPALEAEMQAGDIVTMRAGGVARARRPYDRAMAGVFSSSPSVFINSPSKGIPIGLVGVVPVRVCDVNGAIKSGDPVTSSDRPGVGMKATKPGPIIGLATQDLVGAEGKIAVHLFAGRWWEPYPDGEAPPETFEPAPVTPKAEPAVYADEAVDAPVVPTIDAEALHEKLASGTVDLVFVGAPDFFTKQHIPGARYVPLEDVKKRFSDLPRDREIIFYCGCCSGKKAGMSGAAARTLMAMEFKNVSHLEGHMDAWKALGYPLASGDSNPEPSKGEKHNP